MNQIFKNNAYKILEIFIEHPIKDFSARSIARTLKISHATVLKYLDSLKKQELIKKKNETLYPTYFANTENEKYKFYKRNYIILKIINSGLIDCIQKNVLPSSVILFGSCAKASFTEKSDIDIFVEAEKTNLNLSIYEKKLNRTINILFEPNINNLSEELRNNISNGIILYGFLRVNELGRM